MSATVRLHRRARPLRVGVVRAALALATVLGFGSVATLATFSDSGSQISTFSAGSIDLKFDGSTSDTPSGLSTLTLSNAAPGSTVTKSLTVNNIGSLALVYNMAVTTTSTTSTNLATGLQLNVFSGVAPANCTAANVTAGTTGGTTLTNAATLSTSPTFSSSQTIASSGSQTLCLAVTLPSSAGNSMMGMNTSAIFAFSASTA